MSKYFLTLVFYIFLILNKESFAVNYFDIEAVSDSIVGKLWREIDVPKKDIEELCTLYEEDTKENQVQHVDKANLDKFIDDCKDAMIYTLDWRASSKISNHKNIEDFIKKVRELEDQFSHQAIEKSLDNIFGKY